MVTSDDKTLYSECCQYAIKYISRYPKTEKELSAKLYQKWFNSDQIRYTMDYLKKKKFADDHVFAESYVRSELVNKWKPIIAVRTKLIQKWVDKKIIDSVLSQYESDIKWGIKDRIQKEISNYKKKWVEWFDIIQKLMRKWYPLDEIKKVIIEGK
jgi:regulatory protein